MNYVSKMFQWKRFTMVHDIGAPYTAVAESITSSDDFFIYSKHPVNATMPDDKVIEIFEQVRKYSRSNCLSYKFLAIVFYFFAVVVLFHA